MMSRFTCRRMLATVASMVFASMLLQGCDAPPRGAEPLAVWNDGLLEREEYQRWLGRQNLAPSQGSIESLVLIMSMAAAARDRGMEDSAKVVLAVEARRQAELLPALERHIDGQVSIAGEELEQLAIQYPDAFQQPRKLLLRGIYKRLPAEGAEREKQRERMQSLRTQVVDGADIRPLAVRESESQSRFREGSIGFVDPGRLPEPVGKAVENLEVGEVSELIEHGGGIAFYVCERIKPEVIPNAEQVRARFRQNLFTQRSAELNKALIERLSAGITIRPDQDPVLQVGDQALPADWLNDLVRQRLPGRDPDSVTDDQQRRLLNEWGLRMAMTDHAESLGLAGADGLDEAMRWHRLHTLAHVELRHRVDSRLGAASPAELQALFEMHGERLLNPASNRIAAIQFADAEGVKRPGVVEHARDVLARIRAGELDFSQAARDDSIHASSDGGGELGWMTARQLGSLDLKLLGPVRELSPGEDTGLLRTESGLWLVRLLERRGATPMSFEQARAQLEQLYRKEQIERLEVEVRQDHLAGIGLEILEE